MKLDEFKRPIIVLTAFGLPTVISSAMEAYLFLADWPAGRRDPAHSFAMKACQAAVRGDIEAETARGVFAAFAEKQDILAPDVALMSRGPRADPRNFA
ncbi:MULTISPECIES: DUF982 domain-containing protein [unclassified Bosea (in: a-proteobacteria)]|uniref:DUF982 domain-containing protein n=1 Tax=unclassified Bosea (in: a-proteobacteria) TaxID=2653178 RepID=UPI000F756874|nr:MULTISPECIES: DUF982 domain-containing protein [unclassified Bosea (in: a-proteobacteria)]AZO81897.1 hypothetical protein BLM15_29225 [Bosea sp. Tri-49]MCV9937174.1 DUF982 domain-containing protein [Boseaceae bacterium BT-24-1]RXT16814.1 hypothetical protein B5U98_27025 [Bosea sp. Tri-39]RXT37718.1 hypothetical protein B5U99_12300 [Bosea sp. Tri-54]